MNKRALLSVSNKQGLAEFAAGLVKLNYEILSTGGTARALREAGLEVTDVAAVTGFPEMMDGRVKTLHPAVHGGLLARRDVPEHLAAIEGQGIGLIDIVAVNLYPFQQTVAKPGVTEEEAIENIDIGGPSMVRSASKNFDAVTVVVDPNDYPAVLCELQNGGTTLETRRKLATKAFAHTSAYDGAITTYLSGESFPQSLPFNFQKKQDLRYGENPHQRGAFYAAGDAPEGSLARAEQIHGIGLSFVNLFDLDGAWNLACEFEEPAACIIKHANPCGCAVADSLSAAFIKARDADPVSRFGGIIAANRKIDLATAQEITIKGSLYHAIIAPGFEDDALELLKNRSGWGADLRLLQTGTTLPKEGAGFDLKRVSGGLLVQDADAHGLKPAELKTVTERQPSDAELSDLRFAWKCVKHLKSNAIAVARDGSLIGAGAGQMNRVTSVKLALAQAGENARGAVLASDAFFPFDDGPASAAEAGITAIIQPGGSNRDADSVALCNRENVAMIFTGIRHFKH